jgi:hypothetical protein
MATPNNIVHNLRIKVTEPQVAYFPGQIIKGNILFSVKKSEVQLPTQEEIVLELHGTAISHWVGNGYVII